MKGVGESGCGSGSGSDVRVCACVWSVFWVGIGGVQVSLIWIMAEVEGKESRRSKKGG